MNKVRQPKNRIIPRKSIYKSFVANRERNNMTEAEAKQVAKLQKRTQEIIYWLGKLPNKFINSPAHQRVLRELDTIDETIRAIKKVPRIIWNAEHE